MKTDLYAEITARIIAQLENGVVPWKSPYLVASGLPKNYATGKHYRGINVFLLGSLGFTTPEFMTFIQAKELGGHVRKGEKGFLVVKYGTYGVNANGQNAPQTAAEAAASDESETRRFLKGYTVFHASQIEGIDFPEATFPPALYITEKTDRAREIVAGMPNPPAIHEGGSVPCYRPSTDSVHMPEARYFSSEEAYFLTLFHELGHASGASHRLARKSLTENKGIRADGDTSRKIYAEEELVAEMTAAFLGAYAGIAEEELPNSAAYLQGWIDALKSNDAKGWIVRAAAQAQKAADYIMNVTPT